MRVVAELLVVGLATALFLWWRSVSRTRSARVMQQRLRAVYGAVRVGIVETDLAQRITHCNAAFAAMVGQPLDQIIGRHGWEFMHPDGPPPDPTTVDELIAGRRTSLSAERVLAGPGGAPVAVRLDWAPVLGHRGELEQLACVITDMSVEAREKAQLRQARERAEVLWQRAPIGVVEGTPDGVIVSANEAFAQMLGYRSEELIGMPATSLADPESTPAIAADVASLLDGRNYAVERRYLAKDGTSVPVYVSTATLHDEQGAVSRLAGFVLDLSELTAQHAAIAQAAQDAAAAQHEIIRRQSFNDALLETIDVGIVACDVDGANLTRNRAERVMLGVPAEQKGATLESLAPTLAILDATGRLLEPQDYPLVRALHGEAVLPIDFKVGPVGGPTHEVVIRASQITGPDGEVLGAVAALTDVSAERKAARELEVERGRLNQAQRLGQLGSFSFDLASGEFDFSDQMFRIWGLPVGADLAGQLAQMVHPDDLGRFFTMWKAAVAAGGRHTNEYRIVHPDGSIRHLRVSLEVLRDELGEPCLVNGTHLDVTELTRAEREALEASRRFEAILTATPDFTFVTDVHTGAVLYGSQGKTVLGVTAEQLEERGTSVMATLVDPAEQPRLLAANLAAQDLPDGEVLQIRYRARHVDGSPRWLSSRVTPFRRDLDTRAVIEVLGTVRDVTDVVEAERRVSHTALHDPLTGLPNRALLMEGLEAALARTEHHGREIAVLFCDLDGFKRVNDSAGHAVGDAVLVVSAARLRSALRSNDTVARVGGDEFVIVVEPSDRDSGAVDDSRVRVQGLAERIGQALRQPILVDGVEHLVTVSIGIAYAGPGAATAGSAPSADLILRDADAAMYRAKHGGKDRFELFEHGMRTDLAERGRCERVLRAALRCAAPTEGVDPPPSGVRGATLEVAYQPIVEGSTGRLVSFEALARLTDEHGVAIPPDVFIEVAEQTGLIRDLGLLMLDRACGQLATWRGRLPDMQRVTMAVNISALEAQHPTWGAEVARALSAHHLVAGDLVLELTETAVLQATQSTLTTLSGLRDAGVGIALDDFGTGYASLRYLATLPVSAVKIDRSFTAGLPHDETSRKIVSAVAGLAADLGLECVVEGVETVEQRLALPDGVLVQGWLTGRPQLAGDVESLPLVRAAGA